MALELQKENLITLKDNGDLIAVVYRHDTKNARVVSLTKDANEDDIMGILETLLGSKIII